jgi:hypothetical protein
VPRDLTEEPDTWFRATAADRQLGISLSTSSIVVDKAGSCADVVIPPLGADAVSGKRFGDLTRGDIVNLSQLATSLGRRGDTVKVLGG